MPEDRGARSGRRAWWRPAELLTAEACALAAFALAVATLLGSGTWANVVAAFFDTFAPSRYSTVVASAALGPLLVAALSVALAARTIASPGVGAWAQHLARAAVLVAAVGVFFAVVTLLGGLVG